MKFDIRLEDTKDYRAVEELTREAFWNVHVPGCSEHHILHVLRKSSDFIPGLDFVAVSEDRVVGNIAYSISQIVDEAGANHPVITFGPVSVSPSLQKQGVGSALIRHSLKAAGLSKAPPLKRAGRYRRPMRRPSPTRKKSRRPRRKNSGCLPV